jgi:hypothetical protein
MAVLLLAPVRSALTHAADLPEAVLFDHQRRTHWYMTASHQIRDSRLNTVLNTAVISCNHSDDSGAEGPSQMASLEPQFLIEGLLSKGIIDAIQASHAMLDAISKNI